MTTTVSRADLAMIARQHGLVVVGVTSAEPFNAARDYIIDHIERGHTVGMPWFTVERTRQASDPRTLHDRVESIVSVGVPFWGGAVEAPDDGVLRGRIARYAWGRDYHKTLKRRMVAMVASVAWARLAPQRCAIRPSGASWVRRRLNAALTSRTT